MPRHWFIKTKGGSKGPITSRVLLRLASDGKLLPNSAISSDGHTWIKAKHVVGIQFPAGDQSEPAKIRWYVKTKGGDAGPFTLSKLRKLARQGRIRPNFAVSPDGRQWVTAQTIPGLSFPAAEQPAGSTDVGSIEPERCLDGPPASTPSLEFPALESPALEAPTTNVPKVDQPPDQPRAAPLLAIEEPAVGEAEPEAVLPEEPIDEELQSEAPILQERAVEQEPATEEPQSKQPEPDDSIAEAMESEPPVPQESAVEEPAAEQPQSDQLEPEEWVAEAPESEQPVLQQPVVDEPAAEEPPRDQLEPEEWVAEAPESEQPVVEESAVEEPEEEEPPRDQPEPEESIARAPVSEPPVPHEPVVEKSETVEPPGDQPEPDASAAAEQQSQELDADASAEETTSPAPSAFDLDGEHHFDPSLLVVPSLPDTPPDLQTQWSQKREAEYLRRFGPTSEVSRDDREGAGAIDVFVHPPSARRPMTTLVTSGMSDVPMSVPHGPCSPRAELILYVQHMHADYIRLLRALARLPHDRKARFSYGTLMDNGKPPQPIFRGSCLDGYVFMIPNVESDFRVQDSVRIDDDPLQLLWIVPTTQAERQFIAQHGMEQFCNLLDRNNHPLVLSPSRGCYVQATLSLTR